MGGKKPQTLGKPCQGTAEMHFFIPHLCDGPLPSQTSPLSLYDLTALVPVVTTELLTVPQPMTAL